jgi:periplasmic protein TonB
LSEAVIRPNITPADRLGLTFCLAIICHAVIVLGITFASEDIRQPRYNSMDIVLVQQRSKNNEEAKLLAQASLEGGGDTEEEVSPSTPLPPPFPDNTPKVAAPPPASPPPEPTSNTASEASVETKVEPVSARELLAVEGKESETKISDLVQPQKKEAPKPNKAENTVKKKKKIQPRPSAASLLAISHEIASLNAKVERNLVAKSERPKRKFISASTQEYKYAAYMEAWRAKVERVGNLNYPEKARKRKLTGSLVLAVALNPDGSINDIIVRRSSGHKVLDDSAIRIVRLAAPYSPFPDAILKETDILHITRTWQFLNNRGFK